MPKAATTTVNVTLAWDPSPDPTVTGYRLYQGVASRTYTNTLTLGLVTNATMTNLPAGLTNYFAAKAYSPNLESLFSEEVSYVPPEPPPAPTNLTIISVTVQASADLQSWSNAAVLQAITFTNNPVEPKQFYRALMTATSTNL